MKSKSNGTTAETQLLEDQIMRYVPDSPFVSIKLNEEYHLTLGKYRLTDSPGLKSHEQVFELANSKSWELLMRVFAVLALTTKPNENE